MVPVYAQDSSFIGGRPKGENRVSRGTIPCSLRFLESIGEYGQVLGSSNLPLVQLSEIGCRGFERIDKAQSTIIPRVYARKTVSGMISVCRDEIVAKQFENKVEIVGKLSHTHDERCSQSLEPHVSLNATTFRKRLIISRVAPLV